VVHKALRSPPALYFVRPVLRPTAGGTGNDFRVRLGLPSLPVPTSHPQCDIRLLVCSLPLTFSSYLLSVPTVLSFYEVYDVTTFVCSTPDCSVSCGIHYKHVAFGTGCGNRILASGTEAHAFLVIRGSCALP